MSHHILLKRSWWQLRCHRRQKLLDWVGRGLPTFDRQEPRQSVKDTHVYSFTSWIPGKNIKNIPPDGFFGIQILQNSILAGAPPQTPLVELTMLSRPLVGWEGDTPSPFPTSIAFWHRAWLACPLFRCFRCLCLLPSWPLPVDAKQWIRFATWGYLLALYSYHTAKMHLCWTRSMGRTDKTDGQIILSLNATTRSSIMIII